MKIHLERRTSTQIFNITTIFSFSAFESVCDFGYEEKGKTEGKEKYLKVMGPKNVSVFRNRIGNEKWRTPPTTKKKFGISASKKNCVIFFKRYRNATYFILLFYQ